MIYKLLRFVIFLYPIQIYDFFRLMNITNNTIQSLKEYVFKKLNSFLDERESQISSAILFKHFLNLDRADVLIKKEERVTESEIILFYQAIKKMELGEPIQYVIGEIEFFGLNIKVSNAVLIPRPETEEIVAWILASAKSNAKILDIGTGSGCIPLALKSQLPQSTVLGCDISTEALIIAKQNAENLGLTVSFFECDILNNSLEIPEIDVIVSNPPYIPLQEKILMENNVLDFEPEIALFVSDNDPLVFYRVIAEKGFEKLSNKGMLFFEINEKYGEEVVILMKEAGYSEIEIKKDFQGKERMVKGKKTC